MTRGRTRAIDADSVALVDSLYTTLVHLMRRLRRVDDQLPHSAAHLTTLTTLISRGPSTLGDLAEAEGVRAATMSRRIKELELEGLVLRAASPHDGRVTLLRHSAKAIAVLEQGRAARAAVLGQGIAALGDEERGTLERALEILDDLARSEGPSMSD